MLVAVGNTRQARKKIDSEKKGLFFEVAVKQ